jgi:hypothetical protein
MSMFEQYALSADVVLVAAMFGAYFGGYLAVAHVAIAAFFALSFAMAAKIYREQ